MLSRASCIRGTAWRTCPSGNHVSQNVSTTFQCRIVSRDGHLQGTESLAGAGVRCVVVETRHPSHAKDIMAALPMHELELYDGILAVIFGQTTMRSVCRDAS